MILEDRLGNIDLGGNSAVDSFDIVLLSFPGEEEKGLERVGASLGLVSGPVDLSSVTCSVRLSKSPGDCSRRAPYRPWFSSNRSSCRPRACSRACSSREFEGRGTGSSGVGGIRLIRGCTETGRSRGSSTSVVKPRPVLGCGCRGDTFSWSEAESCDRERKYSDRP